ncbi:CNH-domain-containing protein [Ephemerocybe angulata]|uniref:CNH-domain-containing protein n=1 Tax=Ephemerocybe angulata TaxID=980116 RepID=A0A8H6IC46_9AGAR|nr:CNH-domain-containing protein [Tulosesus angulatus]
MDKPSGPRQQPPDKRHAAYESIFGRTGVPPQQHEFAPTNYPPFPQQNQPYPYQHQAQYSTSDRRTSYSSSNANHQPYPNHNGHPPPPQGVYPQTFYAPPIQHAPPAQYTPYAYPAPPMQTPYVYPASLGPPNRSLSKARSVIGSPAAMSPYTPPHLQEPQIMVSSSSSQPALPLGNGYQSQPYLPRQPSPQPPPHRPTPGTLPTRRPSHGHNSNGSVRSVEPPRLGISLEHDEGRLGIDFASGSGSGSNSASDLGTDEGDSELPYAYSDQPTHNRKSTQSRHSRQPSVAESSRSNRALYVDTSSSSHSPSIRSSTHSSSTPETSLYSHNSRRSLDSNRTIPSNLRERNGDRAMSLSVTMTPPRSAVEPHVRRGSKPQPGPPEGRNSPISIRTTRKTPIVYPALLSRVAEAFRERITLVDRFKDGLTYKDVFDGREAVDKISYIIKTTDRNLALLLGRALDAQKFFHDVTYDHRLRDSASELYQFRSKLPSPFVSGDLPNEGDSIGAAIQHDRLVQRMSQQDGQDASPASPRERRDSLSQDEDPLPSGVFTLLTDCYSPTCSRDRLCYSIACPRRLEQQARLNMKPQPGLSKQISKDSLGDVPDTGSLWIHSVPPEIAASVSDAEKKRQEAINEVIYTERDFVRDMEYLRDVWIKGIQEGDVIDESKKADFITQVFWNVHDILAVNMRLRDALNKRQKQYAIVDRIGDVFLDVVPHFGPFVSYGAHQLWGKYEFEREKNANPAFAAFVELTERLPESRKLELNAYLTKPTTRLARYPLLLEAVLKHTPDDSPDKSQLPKVVTIVREFLAKVNAESGKSENRFKPSAVGNADLRLAEEGREMIHKGPLNKRDGEIQVYLFDHAVLFTKLVKGKHHEQYKVYRRPIPLELLYISAADDGTSTSTVGRSQKKPHSLVKRPSFSKERGSPLTVVSSIAPKNEAKGQHWINFVHLGKRHYNLVLWANSAMAHRKWLEAIVKQQQVMRERSLIFDTVPLSEGFFSGPNKVNCAAPFSAGRRVVYGTDDGVYVSDLRDPSKDPVKVLALLEVTQVDVLEEYALLIVLSERQVITFPLDALDPHDPMAGLKRAKRISSHTSFFKAGYCLDRVLVCIVKSSQLSSTFKTLEPIDQNVRGRAKPTFRKLLQGGNDTLKLFREFYIPVESTSIHYLKTKMCVGCSKGFEIVDLETLDTQGLLDPQDESLEFVRRRENLRPMAIYRIHNDFLLCYDERADVQRKNFMVHWEGQPTGFALHEPYVLAFESTFVEIRHIETGLMSQVIQGQNLRLLFADTTAIYHEYGRYAPEMGYNGYGAPSGSYYGPATPPRHPQGVGRDEILIVSDDRVLSLRTSTGPQRHATSDSATTVSSLHR